MSLRAISSIDYYNNFYHWPLPPTTAVSFATIIACIAYHHNCICHNELASFHPLTVIFSSSVDNPWSRSENLTKKAHLWLSQQQSLYFYNPSSLDTGFASFTRFLANALHVRPLCSATLSRISAYLFLSASFATFARLLAIFAYLRR